MERMTCKRRTSFRVSFSWVAPREGGLEQRSNFGVFVLRFVEKGKRETFVDCLVLKV